jgi:hypothetical protein
MLIIMLTEARERFDGLYLKPDESTPQDYMPFLED